MFDIDRVKFDDKGLVPGIVQTPGGEVRMLGYLSRTSLEQTLESGLVTFWSRSRQALWTKGGTSGNTLRLVEVRLDCDGDALLLIAEPQGPTCHTGADACFEGEPLPQPWLERLEGVLRERKAGASLEGSYTQKLFARGVDRIGKKVVEEAGEVVIGAKNHQVEPSALHREEFLGEAADLLFHLQMLLLSQGFGLQDAARVLQERHRERT
ncbi:bifunctional phosphoribosyl-AMP cyclohydrolase/phosphoribosyl-ATP diphosphatase HisIE [uncultured Tolumonas sp.]|uniref:bifunctional phosphoribosyl-AMP cyclohydrolase/phosphoribosyl-ATP diphosphatase HisIE n=1 Tax=uncultured Tolumonas sp. TaxID=263765 RepID=UPI00292D3959|nr:bifunctional phosphoribosyl-AMP cyclohydrolase/phosphoribosyl-ATP diphosphatase HisIE [uncultured Tolumonas sp.]